MVFSIYLNVLFAVNMTRAAARVEGLVISNPKVQCKPNLKTLNLIHFGGNF